MRWLLFCLIFPLFSQPPNTLHTILAHKGPKVFISTDSAPDSIPIRAAIVSGFSEIHAIDLHVQEHEMAIRRFGRMDKVHLYFHDSPPILKAILANVHSPALFWLNGFRRDALFINSRQVNEKSPLMRELAVIAEHPIHTHTILIGDIDRAGTEFFNNTPLSEILEALFLMNPAYEISFEDQGRILVAKTTLSKTE